MPNATEPLVKPIIRIENPDIEAPDSAETTIDSESEDDILRSLDEDDDAELDEEGILSDDDDLPLEDDDTEIRR